ncbi:phage tail sheath family protein [Polyangium mundeleinium]|uniref:Phage tail sheath subtilisin-like domain-containing protein n=1 Tax=Polyangium mundeleinium TaxID=2995306 RepID=A0ABT5ESM6_9BACT|nr:phage tail sheath subtilisin-like domain-containing protein [Polyangium mundeleinium]MDC0744823.1 phage tail sheath subtilisin-like domain-containing protein [Polyangium mundeleinium]
MPVTTSYPGIYIEELPSTSRTIAAAPTSITVFIGYTHPFKTKQFDKPVRIFSFADYEREFGGLYRNVYLDNSVPYAVQQFFLNGGSDAYVIGLKPQLHPPAPASATAFPKTEASIGTNAVLRALEPTDASSPMTASVSNLVGNVADITISYGSRVEVFRGVKLVKEGIDAVNSIEVRLADSSLVELVEAADYGTYASTSTPVLFQYAVVPDPSATTFSDDDFLPVFGDGQLLDKVDIFNLMVIPGVAHQTVLSHALTFCERKQAFLIVDAPPNYKVEDIVQDPTVLDVIPKSTNGALYFPYLNSLDPLTGSTIFLPPSGTVAGVFARTDTNRGVWKAPAGLETTLRNVSGVVVDGRMTDKQAGVLNDNSVNAIRTFPGIGSVVFGARTLVANNLSFQQWKYVSVRRMALFIEQTLYRNLGWAIFEPNDVPLWTALRTSVEAFMLSLFRQGAFQGTKPSEAFLVQCDSSTTTQADIDLGRVNLIVGFRPLKPAEFVIVKISQLAGQAQA